MKYIYRLFWPVAALLWLAGCVPPITPSGVAVTGITMSLAAQTLPPGTQYTLAATVAPADATDTVVTWTSSIISSFSADQQMWVMK